MLEKRLISAEMTDRIAPGELMNEVNALTRERDHLRTEIERLRATLERVYWLSSPGSEACNIIHEALEAKPAHP